MYCRHIIVDTTGLVTLGCPSGVEVSSLLERDSAELQALA